jgi:hypothetical protein
MGGAAIPRLEVGGAPDRGVPPVSDRPKKEKRGGVCWAGGAAKLGQLGPAYAREKTGHRPGIVHGPKEKEKGEAKEMGRLEEKRERRGERNFLFLLNFFSNSFFKHSNFNQTEIHAFES